MDNPTAIVKFLLPRVPLLLHAAASHTLGLSNTSSKWDLRTELVMKLIRSFVSSPKPTPIGRQQRFSLRDSGIKGPMWIAKVTLPKPTEEDSRKALVQAIEVLKDGEEWYSVPDILEVEAEWTGYRSGVDSSCPRLDLSEQQHYDRLMDEVTSDVTVLYFHGGAFFLMDPSSHRLTCSKLAKLTKGRCLSVRYRLSPQSAFPAALLDAFIAYLTLLAPPPGSFHEPVPAKHIVLSGDSAGGNLALSLLQLILQLCRSSRSGTPTVRFHGMEVEVPVPGGVAVNSAWMDLTRCMPSIYANSTYDYLPEPPSTEQLVHFPKDDLWPTNPLRGDLYSETSMLCHPLVSPLAVKDWRGSCPVWFVYGQECLTDEGKVVARRMAQQGVKVQWLEFEAMPHCFSMILEHLEGSRICFSSWTQFMKTVVEDRAAETQGLYFTAQVNREEILDVTQLLNEIDDEEVDKKMKEAREKRHTGEEGETKLLPRL